jgi:hypothetical protein
MAFPNINISSEPVCGESTIVISRTDPMKLFAAVILPPPPAGGYNNIRGYYSTDGGNTWAQSNLPSLVSRASDPRAVADNFGNIFLTFITGATSPIPRKLIFAISTDFGATFGNYIGLDGGLDLDRPSIATGPASLMTMGSVWLAWFRGA